MTLNSYLKQFNNIAWYPSAFKDSLSMVCLSFKNLRYNGIRKEDAPDCFIFTDYTTYYENEPNYRFFLDVDEDTDEARINYTNDEFSVTAFNIKELHNLSLPFDERLVAFSRDRYYGKVYVADVLVEHPEIGRYITKFVYVIIENTTFAINFLIKNHIKVKYLVHSRYGHGFGGCISNGAYMCNIMKELGTKYFASDMDHEYGVDQADRYLTLEQKSTVPVLKDIVNFRYQLNWAGYNDTILYEVVGFDSIDPRELPHKRFVITNK